MTETDRIAQAYRRPRSVSRWDASNPGNQAILAERRALTRRLLRSVAGKRILEVGCGFGGELAAMVELGASPSNLVGVDLLPERVDGARQAHPDIDFRVANAEHLEFAEASFDVVMALTIFTSILDTRMAAGVAAEMRRVLRPGGGVLWYDFRYDNPFNPHVRGVREGAVRRLFPGFTGELYPVTLIPQIARRLGPITAFAYPRLGAVTPLRSHLLGLLTKPDAV